MLTDEQEAFLEKCEKMFSNRFTDTDAEYVTVHNSGIPDPPIMCPWFGRPKLVARRRNDRDRQYNRDFRDRGFNDYKEYDDRKYNKY